MSARCWLVLALACAALPARALDDDSGSDSRPEVVLWHAQRAEEKDALETFVARVNARERDLRIKVLAVPYDAFLDKITAAVPRGKGPDLFIAAHDPVGDWAEAGTVSPLDDVMDAQLSSSIFDELLPPLVYKGKLWGIPLAFKSVALWRNTKLVHDAPKTLAELEATAKTQTFGGSYGLVYENRDIYYHAPFLFGFGGRLFDDAGKPVVDDPKNIESVRRTMSLARDQGVVPQEVNGALMMGLFNAGKAAMMITGPWSRGELEPGVEYAVSPLPLIDEGRPMRPFLTVEAVMVSGKTEKRALAVRAALLLASEEAAELRLLNGHVPVAQRLAWRALKDNDPNAQFLRAFEAQLPSTVATPNTPAMKALWSPLNLALGESMGQGVDPAVTLKAAQARLDGVMAEVESSAAAAKDGAGFSALLGIALTALAALTFISVRALRRRAFRAKLRDDLREGAFAYAYVAPAMIAMVVLVFVPFCFGVGMGFFHHAWGKYSFVGLRNYVAILTDTDSTFFRTLGMTVLWTVSNVFLHVVIGVLLALVLSQQRLRFRGVYRIIFILPWAVPSYITALIWKGMFHPELGAINALLGTPGFSWMNETWSAFIANLATNTWLGFPFMMVTALGGLTSIPRDLYEAAALDGAGPLTRFFRITLPLLRPTLAPAVVLGSVWTFNMFNVIYLVSGGAPGGKTDILITEAFRWAFERGQGGAFGYAAAYSTLIFLLLVAYNAAANRVARAVSGERAGEQP